MNFEQKELARAKQKKAVSAMISKQDANNAKIRCTIAMDRDLWLQFKDVAFYQRRSMSEILGDYIEQYVSTHKDVK